MRLVTSERRFSFRGDWGETNRGDAVDCVTAWVDEIKSQKGRIPYSPYYMTARTEFALDLGLTKIIAR